ncbi:MAG TPA: MFS transporter [Vicinamibacterales bacterium]|nr:MFS transporter [Vicinamibacterales bacterium]
MNRQRLFVASCVSLLTTSMVFSIRGDIEPAMSAAFHLTKEQMGAIWSPAFWAFTIAIFLSGALVDALGMRSLHALSGLGYLLGVTLVIAAPPPPGPVASIFDATGTTLLYVGFLVMGLSQGLVEGVINPLIATIYRDDKTHKLNVLHAWWPGGLVIGGLLAYLLTQFGAGWQTKLATIMIPAAVYLAMALSQRYPATERVASQVPTAEMWREALRPLFLLLFACMWLTAATELGPDQWFPSVMGALTGLQGILFLVYTAGLMFVLRFFAGPLAHRLSPLGMLTGSAILSAVGLYWLGSLQVGASPVVAFAAATVFGVGKTYFWPTMLGVTAEQFPKGGALLISLMGGAGMLSVAIALPLMGRIFDRFGPGAALQYVAILPAILTVVFGALYLYYRARGGYRPVQLAPGVGVAG